MTEWMDIYLLYTRDREKDDDMLKMESIIVQSF